MKWIAERKQVSLVNIFTSGFNQINAAILQLNSILIKICIQSSVLDQLTKHGGGGGGVGMDIFWNHTFFSWGLKELCKYGDIFNNTQHKNNNCDTCERVCKVRHCHHISSNLLTATLIEVSREFLFCTLSAFCFGPSFTQWITSFIKNIWSCVLKNSFSTTPFWNPMRH